MVVVAAAGREDYLLRSLSEGAEVSVLVVDGTQLVAEAKRRHKLAPTATAAMGRTLLGALLMGSFRKEDEQVQITFQGNGPAGSILAIADTRGNVKGKINNPAADPPLRPDGKLNVGGAVGQGVLAVVRSHPLEPQPYTGMVPIVSGEVAEDLANYLVDSEQTNSALGLGVALDRDCNVKSAGGWLVQILPFCSEETLVQLEQNLTTMPSITAMLNEGMSPEAVTERILQGLGVMPGAERVVPKYGPCEEETLKKRMIRAVASLGKKEVADIIAQEGKLEVTCDLCQQTYNFSQGEVDAYLDAQRSEREEEEEEEQAEAVEEVSAPLSSNTSSA
ncbi:hypothetical protein CHLRE_17g715000v5 [Chlamydomonas reinhardtii]|nr:uncharacterized protein CHLRE_17g715000v5 [Chlamydomonas reinhardtii]PNW70318.1 hypothetical protein CHLRE_17g715000v5 [Chlamydomonas reinhardtii]